MSAPDEFDVAAVTQMFGDAITMFLGIIAPILLAAFAVGVVANVVQVGFVFSTKALAPKFDRINPLSGFKRIFPKGHCWISSKRSSRSRYSAWWRTTSIKRTWTISKG